MDMQGRIDLTNKVGKVLSDILTNKYGYPVRVTFTPDEPEKEAAKDPAA